MQISSKNIKNSKNLDNPQNNNPTNRTEKVIYDDGPSQYVNFSVYTNCAVIFLLAIFAPALWHKLVIGGEGFYHIYILFWRFALAASIIYPIWRFFDTFSRRYKITNERLREYSGVFNRKVEELELYRVKDISLDSPFNLRMLGLSNIILRTTDRSNPYFIISSIKNGEKILDLIRENVEYERKIKGVRAIEL